VDVAFNRAWRDTRLTGGRVEAIAPAIVPEDLHKLLGRYGMVGQGFPPFLARHSSGNPMQCLTPPLGGVSMQPLQWLGIRLGSQISKDISPPCPRMHQEANEPWSHDDPRKPFKPVTSRPRHDKSNQAWSQQVVA